MNFREIDTEAKRLAAERGWGGFEDPHTNMLVLLLSAREDARHALNSRIGLLRRDLDRLEQILKPASPILNTLGELQSRPPSIEAAVGEFAAAAAALRNYLETFPAKDV